jgi:acyl-homoserine lactone acylase PvdQ
LNTATTLEEAVTAARGIRRAAFNLLAAHRDGGIAWQVTGALPQRGRGSGAFPVPGWKPGFGWQGYIPAEKNPGVIDPPASVLVNANDRSIPADHPVRVTSSWMAPYRGRRIRELLAARTELTASDLTGMQLDRQSAQARVFQAALARHGPEIRVVDAEARRIADEYLMTWDGRFEPDSRAAALFALLRPALYEAIFGDELGEDLPVLMSVATLSYNALDAAVRNDRSSFWDDRRTALEEGPAHALSRALRLARDRLRAAQPELGEQRLDRLLSLTFPHAFHRLPVIGPLFDVGPIPVGGDEHTVNVMKANPLSPGEATYIPTLRVVFTPADWNGTRGTLALGQSGHRFSPHRADQLDDWLAGETRPWPWNGPEPGSEIGVLQLRPEATDG